MRQHPVNSRTQTAQRSSAHNKRVFEVSRSALDEAAV